MENERRHGVLAVNKKIFVAAPALAVAISFGNAHLLSQGHEISEIEPIAQSSFKTLVIEDNDYLDKEQKLSHSNLHFTVEPSSSTPMATDVFKSSPVEKKLSKTEQKIENIKNNRDYLLKLAKDSNKFNANLLDDLHDNLPFQLAATKKYPKVSWIVLFVMQERESGGSSPSSKAFDKSSANSRVQGSYQIDIGWKGDFTSKSFKGLEYTKAFPMRHKGDDTGAAVTANMFERNINLRLSSGLSYEQALYKSIAVFCGIRDVPKREVGASDEVNKRMDMVLKYEKIFNEQAEKGLAQ